MFSLLYGLWEYLSRKEEIRILILGLDKAGKKYHESTVTMKRYENFS